MGGVNNCWLGFSLSPNLSVDLQESTQSQSASSNSNSMSMSMSMVHNNHNHNHNAAMAFARDSCYEVVSSSHNVESPEITTLRSDGSLFILDRSQPQEWQTRSMVAGSELQSQHLINADLSMLVGGRNDYEHHHRGNHSNHQEGPKLEDFLGGASLGGDQQYSESRNETRQTSMENMYGAAQSFNVGEGMKMMLTDSAGRLFGNFDMADSELSATDDSKPHSNMTFHSDSSTHKLNKSAGDEPPPQCVGGGLGGDSFVPTSTDYHHVFPDCSLQLPQASVLHTNSSDNNNNSSGINGLSMIKTWLTNQPCSAESKMKMPGFGASTIAGGAATTAGEGKEGLNALQSLSLSMSPTSQSTTSMAIVPLPSDDALVDSSESKKRALVLSEKPTSLEPALRKSIDTFGQRTSIYRGVTRHRWTGRYEAHLWDNSCRREGQTRKGRQVYLGGYDKEEKAARAYDLAALKYWGPTTTTNFPISNYEKELEEMKHMTRQEYVASLRRKSSGFSRGASMYRGVTRHHQHGRWQARIGRVAGNKDLYLGTFSTQEEAAEAYDIAAIKFRGLNAVTNFDMSRYDVKSILASSTLPVGGHVKRIKEAEPSDPSVEARHHDEDSTLSSYAAISYNNASSKQEWPIIAALQNHHHASQQARAWCKQEQGTQSQHDLQVQLQSFHNQKFYQPHFANATVLHNLMSLESPSPVDNTNNNSTGSTSALYSNISSNNQLLSNGIVMASHAPTIQSGAAVTLVSENNQTRAPFGQNEHGNLKAYENMGMYGIGDAYARGVYYLPQQQPSSGNMKANYDPNVASATALGVGGGYNNWIAPAPTQQTSLAPRPNITVCHAPIFSIWNDP